MKTINSSLLALALVGSCIPAIAMEQPNANNNNNNNSISHKSKFTFANVNRDSGLGTLWQLPNEKILEIMLFCIDRDKTTLEEAFRTIQSLCESSKFLYNFAHVMLFDVPSVAELRERIQVIIVMERYKQEALKAEPDLFYFMGFTNNDVNALQIAVANGDLEFLKQILPKLKKCDLLKLLEVTNVAGDGILVNLVDNLICKGHPQYPKKVLSTVKLLLEYGASSGPLAFMAACSSQDADVQELSSLLAVHLTCTQVSQMPQIP